MMYQTVWYRSIYDAFCIVYGQELSVKEIFQPDIRRERIQKDVKKVNVSSFFIH
jgi:hypothetical protein